MRRAVGETVGCGLVGKTVRGGGRERRDKREQERTEGVLGERGESLW